MIKFPFKTKRKSQDEMIDKVKTCIENQKNLLVHAPTGIGKTVSALYPAVKQASEKGLTVFFLTPRHSQHQIALETLKKMGITNVVDIIGKRWLCNYNYDNLTSQEFQELCNYLKKEEKCKYYNRVYKIGDLTEDAKFKIDVLDKKLLNSEEIKDQCKDFCTYEISCQLAKRSLVIVGDYFHLFNPYVSTNFLSKIDKELENSIIIVDEAHQLPGRARDLLSSRLTTFVLRSAYKEAREMESEIADDIENFRLRLQDLVNQKLKDLWETYVDKRELAIILNSLGSNFLEELEEISDLVRESGKERSFCSSLLNFIDRWMESDNDFTRIIKRKNGKYENEFEIRMVSLLPSKVTSNIINNSYSTILMSATLQPLEMYVDLLGVQGYETVSFKPVFPKENRLNIIAPITTTKYSKRGETQYRKYADAIEKIFERVNGNTAVFFPSYIFLRNVRSFINNSEIFEESSDLNKEQKATILNRFIKSEKALLLGVQGGSFDQGIDIPNNSLKCIIIAGLALATPDLETKSLIDCYNKKYGKGMEYAYIFPAIQKAIQASGRAIRSEKDRAAVIYLDERFLWRNYRRVLEGENFVVSKEPWREIEKFNSI
jgi:DNA excision repair protein ERCC-2